MNNQIMQLMGRNEWDTPNVRRACKGAFEPQDRHQKDARQKRARADKPFYQLLDEMKSQLEKAHSMTDYYFHGWMAKHVSLHMWKDQCAELVEEAKKHKKQIKGQKTRIKNLQNK